MNFIIEYNHGGSEMGSRMLPSLNALKADTLPLALREVQKALLECSDIDSATVYVPVRVLRAARKIDMTDANGNAVAVDTPMGDLDGRIRPLVDPEKEKRAEERAESLGLVVGK